MVVNDRSRRALAASLERVLGAEEADVLMESLPPSGWTDVATKADLDAFEERMTLRFESRFGRLDERISGVEGRLDGRIDGVESRLGRVEDRLDGVESSLKDLQQQMNNLILDVSKNTRVSIFATLGTGGVVLGALGLDRLLS